MPEAAIRGRGDWRSGHRQTATAGVRFGGVYFFVTDKEGTAKYD
jgi:hypothetical protein